LQVHKSVNNKVDGRWKTGAWVGTMNDPSDTTSALARLVTDAETARLLSDALMEAFDPGETAVAAFEDRTGVAGTDLPSTWTVEIFFERAPNEAAVRALIGDLAGDAARDRLAFATVAARDWVAQSLAGLQPVEAGRFVIHGAHHRGRVAANRIGIEIEAALAFGTGHHGTTRGCLMALDRILKRRRPRSILDVGTGTGVLAIAAARSARRPVLAGDIDLMSVRLARDNARLNRVAAFTEIIRANGLSDRRMRTCVPFDLVFANILLGPLKLLAKPIRRLAARGAHVVVSGLLPGQANAALAAYRTLDLVLERRVPLDGWVTLILKRDARRVDNGVLRRCPPGRTERCDRVGKAASHARTRRRR
jgi:ribosomal protein L11 methyltransferase